jgi:adenine deaminase
MVTVPVKNMDLVDVAMGRSPADLVIQNGRWVCVQSGEVIEHTDIAILKDRIAFVGPDASHTIGEQTQLVQAENQYLVPGLLDAHMHVESGMLTVTEFVRAVLPSGTTGMFVDPHEIANVFGLEGVRLMVDEALKQPIHVWVQAPSCVPSAPGLETPGASLDIDEIAEALSWPGVIGLGEVMDFPGVIANQPRTRAVIESAQMLGKVVGGHYASPDLGLSFHGYFAGGPEDDHEGTTLEGALARARQGMKVMMRFGSAWHDVVAQVRAVTELGLDPRHFLLCTDDSHSGTLVNEGHVNRALRVAIEHGVPALTAIQMATLNTAEHFGVSQLVGQIAARRSADILLVADLKNFAANMVIAKGVIVAQKGRLLLERRSVDYPSWARQSINLRRPVHSDDFKITFPVNGKVKANVIGILENQAPTRHLKFILDVKDGEVDIDKARDIAKVALVERHHASGRIQVGLVHGFGFNTDCAVATSVAHDSHHILVVGVKNEDMAQAVNELARIGGDRLW